MPDKDKVNCGADHIPFGGRISGAMAGNAAGVREKSPILGGSDMILVTVGTHYQKFHRLIEAADYYAATTDERVIIQSGCCCYKPIHSDCFDFIEYEKLKGFFTEARVIVMHAAAGSILLGLKMGKPLVLVPRKKRYHEHNDDHQLELAEALDRDHKAVMCDPLTAENLSFAIEKAYHQIAEPAKSNELIVALRQYLMDLDEGC